MKKTNKKTLKKVVYSREAKVIAVCMKVIIIVINLLLTKDNN